MQRTTSNANNWTTEMETPRSYVVYLCQVFILYTIHSQHLQFDHGVGKRNFVDRIFNSCLEYFLPNRSLKTKHVFPDAPQYKPNEILSRQYRDQV